MYRKLKRTWSHNDANYIPRFKEVFPELSNINSDDLADRFIDLKMDFYTEVKTPVNLYTRFTLPIALVVILLMFIYLPINFFITGNWGFTISKSNPKLLNWLRSLRLY
ncbi:hypothetical protein [Flavobacterium muglaense]|uniref:hypothetical protein n=1 Tax=Flavobacterium muglaense TaxID=2764716 RepID=UPI001C9B7380|nr:hypothetical protein [Flavobacterium muglaense]